MLIDQQYIYDTLNRGMNTYLGPYGKVKLQLGDNISKTRQMIKWNMAYIADEGNSSVPEDDKPHYDNYRIRTKEMKNLEHTYTYTYNPNYNVLGLALILDINNMRFRTKVLIPGTEYVYQDYQYLMDVRYLHNDCRYIVWVVDGNEELIIRRSINTFLLNQRPGESDAEYIERMEFLNEEDVKLPDYATYRFNLAVAGEQSGNQINYYEISNIDMEAVTFVINITNNTQDKGATYTIDTEHISKNNTNVTYRAGTVALLVDRRTDSYLYTIAIRIFQNQKIIGPGSSNNRYIILNNTVNELIEYSNGDEVEINYQLYDSQGCVIMERTGNYERSNIAYTNTIRDTNFKFKFNN